MSPDQDNNERGRILPFRARAPASKIEAFSNLSADQSPVQDLEKYGRGNDADDYAHRMKMNALAVVVLAVLVAGGIWIVDTMAQMRKNQDCTLTGRRNCGQVTVVPPVRPTAP